MDSEKIKNQAKRILDNFADALASVEKETKEEGVEREDFERKEGNEKESTPNPEFRQDFLKNSPNHDADFIIAERGDWK